MIDEKKLDEELELAFELEEKEKERDEFLSYSIYQSLEVHDAKIYHRQIREGD